MQFMSDNVSLPMQLYEGFRLATDGTRRLDDIEKGCPHIVIDVRCTSFMNDAWPHSYILLRSSHAQQGHTGVMQQNRDSQLAMAAALAPHLSSRTAHMSTHALCLYLQQRVGKGGRALLPARTSAIRHPGPLDRQAVDGGCIDGDDIPNAQYLTRTDINFCRTAPCSEYASPTHVEILFAHGFTLLLRKQRVGFAGRCSFLASVQRVMEFRRQDGRGLSRQETQDLLERTEF